MRSPSARARHHAAAGGALWLTVSGVLAAATGWLTLLVVARAGGPTVYQHFVVVWSVYFLVAGVLVGLQQEVTRALTVPAPSTSSPGPRLLAAVAPILGVAVPLTAVVFVVTVNATGHRLAALVVTTSAGSAVLVLATAVIGVWAAEGRWRAIASAGVADQVLRLLLVTAAVLLAELRGVTLVAVVFAGLLVLVPWIGHERGRRLPAGETSERFVRRAAAAMVTTGCSNALIVGLPFIIEVTGPVPPGTGPAVFAAIFLTRSPLLIPANAMRPLALRVLLDHRGRLSSLMTTRLLPWSLTAAAVAGAAGWVAGPPALRLVFGAEFVLSRGAMAGFSIAAVLMLLITGTGMTLIALDHHSRSTIGWLVSLCAAVLLLLLPVDLVTRCLCATVVGPLAGIVVHVRALVAAPSARPGGPPTGVDPHP